MVVEDLQHIVPDLTKAPTRRVYLMMGVVVGVMLLVLLVMAIALGVLYAKEDAWKRGVLTQVNQGPNAASVTGNENEVCLTPGCLHSASWMLDNLDLTVDPCDDFYGYACGGWLKRTEVPPDENDISVLEQLHDTKDEVERRILMSKVRRDTDKSYERKMKTLFKLCMSSHDRMTEGGSSLLSYISQHVGSWYALDPQGWSSTWDFQRALTGMHVHFMTPVLFVYYVQPDPRQFASTGHNLISIRPSGPDYQHTPPLEGQPGFSAYQTYIRKTAHLLIRDSSVDLDSPEEDRRVEQFMNDVIAQEAAISRVVNDAGDLFTWETDGPFVTLSQLSQNYTKINWQQILSSVFTEVEINGDTEVLVSKAGTLLAVEHMLRDESTEADRMMNNYMVWSVVRDYADYMSWEYRHAKDQYRSVLSGRTRSDTTWHQCVHVVRGHMGHAVAASFFREHVGAERKYQVQRMTAYIKQGLMDQVDALSWMDDETKVLAKRKVELMTQAVGYPHELDDDQFLDRMYDKLDINETRSFMETLVMSGEYARQYLSRQLLEGINANIWDQTIRPHDFGLWIHYLWGANKIFVPGGIFRFPFFTDRSPHYMNYGALGTRVAGQMAISVDEMGKNMYNGSYGLWWSDDTLVRYQQEKVCYVNYFSNITAGPYVVDGEQRTVPIDATRRMWTILLRHAAMKVAYAAYDKWKATNGTEKTLPGLRLTPRQIFFLSAAQTRCAKYDDAALFQWVSHGFVPNDILMNGVLSHMPEFSEAFSCPSGSRMHSSTRCSVF